MSTYLSDDFLLSTELAASLYHDVAAPCPIVDVHNHLVPDDIAGDRTWSTLTELWLDDDHYKWKAMRLAGVDEALVTGDGDPWEKFAAWAATIPRTIGNPLHVWTHLELRRVFGIDLVLTPGTAREIYDEANRQLPRWSARAMLRHFDVRAVATTDDPTSALVHHTSHAEAGAPDVAMLPTFRPDAAHRLLDDPTAWNAWVSQLTSTTGVRIGDLDSLLDALSVSSARMATLGGRASDHGLTSLPDRERDAARADAVVRAALNSKAATDAERECVLLEVVALAARLAHADDSVLQLHLGPLRNVSPRLLERVGRDVGADVMDDQAQARGLARFLGGLERDRVLPRTIIYNLNPADNLLFATLAGAFSRAGVPSLVQWGPPWWFNDHEDGMRRQLEQLGQVHQLAGFVGMLTDSRSILSMTRHELFRRTLCDVIGREVQRGLYPDDRAQLRELVRAVCVGNAVEYFGLPSAWAS
jgi:glucuronate isomerase